MAESGDDDIRLERRKYLPEQNNSLPGGVAGNAGVNYFDRSIRKTFPEHSLHLLGKGIFLIQSEAEGTGVADTDYPEGSIFFFFRDFSASPPHTVSFNRGLPPVLDAEIRLHGVADAWIGAIEGPPRLILEFFQFLMPQPLPSTLKNQEKPENIEKDYKYLLQYVD